MFRESDRVFIPLSVIYANPTTFVGDVLSLKRSQPRKTQQPQHVTLRPQSKATTTYLEMIGVVAVAFASFWAYSGAQGLNWGIMLELTMKKMEDLFLAVVNFPFWLFDVLIELPLRELYRHGPSMIGWEGEPLARICARVTYHGDEDFWSRNMVECERIYASKESAAMQVRKPLLVVLVIAGLFYMAKSIVEARALRRREQLDPNMVETFRAINMLVKQLRRAANTR